MEALRKLETVLDDVFEKKAPYQLPQNARKAIAGAMWWLALIFGLLQLWAVWGLWHLGHLTTQLVDYSNRLSVTYGTGEVTTAGLGLFYYLSLVVLAVDALLMLFAVTNLKAFRKRRGWNFLYYSMVVNVAYALVRAFSEVGGGFGQLIMGLISSAIGAYFLFQIRSYFMPKSSDHKVGVEKTTFKTVK